MEHKEWIAKIQRITGEESQREICRKAEIPHRTFNSQSAKGRFSPDTIIKIAVTYDIELYTALLDTGYIPPEYAQKVSKPSREQIAQWIRYATDKQLTDEVLDRLERASSNAFTTPINELEELRNAKERVDDVRYSADDSPTEPEPGDDDYGDGP